MPLPYFGLSAKLHMKQKSKRLTTVVVKSGLSSQSSMAITKKKNGEINLRQLRPTQLEFWTLLLKVFLKRTVRSSIGQILLPNWKLKETFSTYLIYYLSFRFLVMPKLAGSCPQALKYI